MVRDNHGHGHRFDPAQPVPLQGALAVLAVGDSLCGQPRAVHLVRGIVAVAVRLVASHSTHHGQSTDPGIVLEHHTYGRAGRPPPCFFGQELTLRAVDHVHVDQHDGFCLCSCLGRVGGIHGLGVCILLVRLKSVSADVWSGCSLWMADAVMSLVCALWLPFLLIKRTEKTPLSGYTALQLFPIIATVVAAASAAVVANAIPRPEQALATIIIGYVLWGLGLPAALFIMIVYFQRLAIHPLPPREVIVSCFMPIGPLGMGGFAISRLGNVALKVFPLTKTIHPLAGDLAYNLGILLCLVMWGFTLLWLFLAVATIHHCKRFPFNMGWWG